MQFQPQVQQALKQLPIEQRVIALALKNIYERIKNLHEKQEKEIENNRLSFIQRFKQIQQKTAEIVNGKNITEEELTDVDKYFVVEEENQMKNLLGTSMPIKEYWLVALKNSQMAEFMTPEDEKILACLTNLSQNVTETSFQISLTFKGSNVIKDGTYKRVAELSGGMPVEIRGDSFGENFKLKQGLLYELSKNQKQKGQIATTFEILTFLIVDFIPYSLRYFLGEAEYEIQDGEDEENEEEGSQQEQDDSGQNQGQGSKKRPTNP